VDVLAAGTILATMQKTRWFNSDKIPDALRKVWMQAPKKPWKYFKEVNFLTIGKPYLGMAQ